MRGERESVCENERRERVCENERRKSVCEREIEHAYVRECDVF